MELNYSVCYLSEYSIIRLKCNCILWKINAKRTRFFTFHCLIPLNITSGVINILLFLHQTGSKLREILTKFYLIPDRQLCCQLIVLPEYQNQFNSFNTCYKMQVQIKPFGKQDLFCGYYWMRTSRSYIGKILTHELDINNLKVRKTFYQIRVIFILKLTLKIIKSEVNWTIYIQGAIFYQLTTFWLPISTNLSRTNLSCSIILLLNCLLTIDFSNESFIFLLYSISSSNTMQPWAA